jgi:hypothetical protein
LETYTKAKGLVPNPHFLAQRQNALSKLSLEEIDGPVVELISRFATLPYCFTLQCCYGHFLYKNQTDAKNIEPLPIRDWVLNVEYRIAYIALCVQNNEFGKELLKDLSQLPLIDSQYIQFGCADWFWGRQVNTYVLQVEPERFKTKDQCVIGYQEALRIEKVRNRFFEDLWKILDQRT